MRPKIQLAGGCASSFFVNEVQAAKLPDSVNDGQETAEAPSGEAGALLQDFLAIILARLDASAGIIRVISPGGNELKSVASSGLPAEILQQESVVDVACGICGESACRGEIVVSNADFCKNRYGQNFFGEACKFILAVPLVSADGKNDNDGVLTLFFSAEKIITEEIKLTLRSYADLINIALKNVWQRESSHQSNLLAERQSIANEIHDSLAQTLYYAKMRASLLLDAMKTDNDLLAYKCAQDIEESLAGSQKTVRELVTHFRCQMDPQGLRFALQKLAGDFIARTSIRLEYINPLRTFDLPLNYELQIFLIIRESLVNIATHSGATIASLEVKYGDGQYRIVVEDNGGGVDTCVPPEGHYGLAIMRERASRIGGVVEVESLQGLGTRVQLIFSAPEA